MSLNYNVIELRCNSIGTTVTFKCPSINDCNSVRTRIWCDINTCGSESLERATLRFANKRMILPFDSPTLSKYVQRVKSGRGDDCRVATTTQKPSGVCRRINQLMTAPLCPIRSINSIGVSARVPVVFDSVRYDRFPHEPRLSVSTYFACRVF